MKFGAAILVALVVCLCPSVNGAETDVIRVFDHKLHVTPEKMKNDLKKADLEQYGFKKSVEVSSDTDVNGKTRKKTTIFYTVTDDCSKVMFWERILEKRMPKLLASNISSITVKELQDHIAGRQTKSCTVGLEIHPNRCLKKIGNNGVTKLKRTASVEKEEGSEDKKSEEKESKSCRCLFLCILASIRYV